MKTFDLKIIKSVYGGSGLGFHDDKAIFVPFAHINELVRVEVTSYKRDHGFAQIVEILEPSKKRVEPRCCNFGICGGCDYLHLDYDEEISIKQNILKDSLVRIAKIDNNDIPKIDVVYSNRDRYRSHASVKNDNEGKIGFYKKGTNDLVAFPPNGCLLLPESLVQIFLKPYYSGYKEFKAAIGCNNKVSFSYDEDRVIKEIINSLTFNRDIHCFFQVNLFLRNNMLDIVREYAALSISDNFLDIGCGIGFFTLYLSKDADFGIGVDIDRESILWAQRNRETNSIDNVEFIQSSGSSLSPHSFNPDLIVADPSRAGLSKKTRYVINAMQPKRLIYVSCNPSTFSRDTKDFIKNRYKLKGLTLIDMFPSTYHIELIAYFCRDDT
ncbi:MAG: methyltransferase domain-containing protein [Spirochaetota bacterium]|nr:methyltransferase domain-containing protein [Spirochaetota bacterium]